MIRMRTGSEPATARSALRARFWLSLWGVAWAIFGTAAFAFAGRTGWAAACGALWLVATIDLALVVRHRRQGPHYQPGPDIPPYRPVDSELRHGPRRPYRSRRPFGRPPRHGHP
jgi:hypothetical protein